MSYAAPVELLQSWGCPVEGLRLTPILDQSGVWHGSERCVLHIHAEQQVFSSSAPRRSTPRSLTAADSVCMFCLDDLLGRTGPDAAELVESIYIMNNLDKDRGYWDNGKLFIPYSQVLSATLPADSQANLAARRMVENLTAEFRSYQEQRRHSAGYRRERALIVRRFDISSNYNAQDVCTRTFEGIGSDMSLLFVGRKKDIRLLMRQFVVSGDAADLEPGDSPEVLATAHLLASDDPDGTLGNLTAALAASRVLVGSDEVTPRRKRFRLW